MPILLNITPLNGGFTGNQDIIQEGVGPPADDYDHPYDEEAKSHVCLAVPPENNGHLQGCKRAACDYLKSYNSMNQEDD